jgi:hypothetical protein
MPCIVGVPFAFVLMMLSVVKEMFSAVFSTTPLNGSTECLSLSMDSLHYGDFTKMLALRLKSTIKLMKTQMFSWICFPHSALVFKGLLSWIGCFF